MSQTMSQTEDIGTGTEEATGAHADELANLSTEQLEALIEEQSDENAKTALQALLEERRRLESQLAETKTGKAKKEKAPAKSRKGSRAPKGRQVKAAESFNANQENLDRLKRVLEGDPNADPPVPPVIQADGTYKMTPHLVQLGISGYYDERRNEGGSATKAADSPIIPPAADAAGEGAAPESESESVTDSHVVEGEDELVEPKASAGPPYNPHHDDND
jgi:hypothetical protein